MIINGAAKHLFVRTIERSILHKHTKLAGEPTSKICASYTLHEDPKPDTKTTLQPLYNSSQRWYL